MPVPEQTPFVRLQVTHAVEGVTRVEWELSARFRDPRPHTFQLQVAPTATPAEADWADVGLPAENAFYLVDDEQRNFGKTLEHHWRVVLATPAGTYASGAAAADEYLERRDWRYAREILRQLRKRSAKFTGVEVALFKRRRYGEDCACVDPHLGETANSSCPDCFGTGKRLGYHAAVTGLWADLPPEAYREFVAPEGGGTVKNVVVRAHLPGFPLVSSRDVVASRRGGRRWFVEEVLGVSSHRGYPLRVEANLRLAQFKDPVYSVPDGGS
jgi:hypothetical protein